MQLKTMCRRATTGWQSSRQRLPPTWNRRSSVSQRLGAERLRFPGAVDSKFVSKLEFARPSLHEAIPTYRVMDSDGAVIDESRAPDVSEEEIIFWYKNMLSVSIMDLIMFDAQRQGRLSFYMVSAGEEGIAFGSASALKPEDVVFAQYRETGVFKQRGFRTEDFMNQLFANHRDLGRGRNMPVHYGNKDLNHVSSLPLDSQQGRS